jgi:ParD-like antitoxin of type II bacterial toxin-antitoxin system
MATTVKLADHLVEDAKRVAALEHRSVPKQIEFYYAIARAAEQNPDLSFHLVRELLKSKAEEPSDEYQFGK